MRQNIVQPESWWQAWKDAADAEGMKLSTWVGKQCNAQLTQEVRQKLSSRNRIGRPKKDLENLP